jgi:hypothetical protein
MSIDFLYRKGTQGKTVNWPRDPILIGLGWFKNGSIKNSIGRDPTRRI